MSPPLAESIIAGRSLADTASGDKMKGVNDRMQWNSPPIILR
jgi:hypothetical protein